MAPSFDEVAAAAAAKLAAAKTALAAVGKLKLGAAVAGLLVVSLVGAFALGVLGAPSVEGVENRFGEVTDETTVVHTDLLVHNPNPIGVQLGGTTVNYTVAMNDVEMATGGREGLHVESGTTTIPFETGMENAQIPPWWVSHVENGERTNVSVDATVRTSLLGEREFDFAQEREVETDIIGEFDSNETRPVHADDPPPLLENPVLYVNETAAQWGSVSPERTPILMDFVFYNPQTVPYAISELGYEITMNGVDVGEGQTEDLAVIQPGATETVRTTTEIRNGNLDDWWVTHLRNDQVTELRIEFYAELSGEELLGDVRVPLDELTYKETIETDIFDNKGEGRTDDPDATDDSGSDTSDRGTNDSSASPTPESGQELTLTPTPDDSGSTATPDEDDGVGLPSLAHE